MSNYTGKFVPGTDNNPWNKAFDMVKDGTTVLDVGCSTGNFGAALMEHKGCIVDGIEPDAGDYEEAAHRLRNVEKGFVEDALEKRFKNQKYDHIVFLDVVEHLYDPVATLKLIKPHLKPGGTIIFSIPNMAHASVRLMLLKGDFEYGKTGLLDNTHLHFYTIREIERVFSEAGYAISILDNVEASYPSEMITSQLDDLGIKETPTLKKLLNRDDARVFQYVGAAVINTKAHKVARKQYSPDPQGAISSWYQGHIQQRDNELSMLRKRLNDQAKNYEDQIRRIKQSKPYVIGHIISAPYRIIRKQLMGSRDGK